MKSTADKIQKNKTLNEVPKSLVTIALFLLTGSVGLFLYQKYFLNEGDSTPEQRVDYTLESFEKDLNNMDEEAKIHYENSQELFKQMRENIDDPDEVRELNDENIAELKKALEIEPNVPALWQGLGTAYTWVSSEGTLVKGLEAYRKAEELDPDNAVYINNVGDMLIRLGRYEEAIQQFQKTLELPIKSGLANLSLGMAYKETGDYDSAREHFQKAISIFEEQNSEGSFDDEILRAEEEIANLPE